MFKITNKTKKPISFNAVVGEKYVFKTLVYRESALTDKVTSPLRKMESLKLIRVDEIEDGEKTEDGYEIIEN